MGVEAVTMVGAFAFFVGTLMFASGWPLEGEWYQHILAIWVVGSAAFTTGSLILGYRHFAMGL